MYIGRAYIRNEANQQHMDQMKIHYTTVSRWKPPPSVIRLQMNSFYSLMAQLPTIYTCTPYMGTLRPGGAAQKIRMIWDTT